MKVAGIPFDQGNHPQGALRPTAIVLHRTYGGWKGSYSVGKNGRSGVGIGFHFLVGKAVDQWVQFYDTTVKSAHAKGANSWAVGIEFEGVNEDVLTDWQVRAGAWIIASVTREHGIPRTYYVGSRKQVDGLLPHASVPGSDHTDLVTPEDFSRMASYWDQSAFVPPSPIPNPPKTDKDTLRRIAAATLLNNRIGNVPVLHRGDNTQYVRALQQGLTLVTGAQIKADGNFGPATEDALRNFQRFFGLPVDGVFGPKSRFVLVLALQKIANG